jgi:hypothetical protein
MVCKSRKDILLLVLLSHPDLICVFSLYKKPTSPTANPNIVIVIAIKILPTQQHHQYHSQFFSFPQKELKKKNFTLFKWSIQFTVQHNINLT